MGAGRIKQQKGTGCESPVTRQHLLREPKISQQNSTSSADLTKHRGGGGKGGVRKSRV